MTELPLPNLPPGLNLNKVLCWVSSTEVEDRVVSVARAFCDAFRGRCHVVMCLDSLARTGRQENLPQVSRKPLTPETIGQAGYKLAQLYGDDVHTMVLPGHPVVEVRRYARNQQMDLVVIGEQALALESDYGERLLDNAPCAVMVLIIPQHKEKPSTGRSSNSNGSPQLMR